MVTLHAAGALFIPNCAYPKAPIGIMAVHYSFMFILFFDFYKKTYVKKKE